VVISISGMVGIGDDIMLSGYSSIGCTPCIGECGISGREEAEGGGEEMAEGERGKGETPSTVSVPPIDCLLLPLDSDEAEVDGGAEGGVGEGGELFEWSAGAYDVLISGEAVACLSLSSYSGCVGNTSA